MTRGYRFESGAGREIRGGKSHYPDFIRLHINRRDAFGFAMNVLRQLECPGPNDDVLFEVPLFGQLERVPDDDNNEPNRKRNIKDHEPMAQGEVDFSDELYEIAMLTTRMLAHIAYSSRCAFEDSSPPETMSRTLADCFWIAQFSSFMDRLVDALRCGERSNIAGYCTSLMDLFGSIIATREPYTLVPGDMAQAVKRMGAEHEIQHAIQIIESIRAKVDAAVQDTQS